MAQQNPEIYENKVEASDEVQDRGILDFLEKKEEKNKPESELSVPDFAKDHVVKAEELKEEEEHNHPTSIKKLDRSNSNSSSSSDEEEGKPKKGLKEKIKETVTGEKPEDPQVAAAVEPEEKQNFMEKMKAKLPGANKEGHTVTETTPVPATETVIPSEETEKKGFMEKIKEKLPGHHADSKVG